MSEPLPLGVVTLVMGDLAGSVLLWEQDPESMASAMARVDEIIDAETDRWAGVRPGAQGEGDNFVLAFSRVSDALAAASAVQRRLAGESWPADLDLRFRMGVHTGEISVDPSNRYEGPTINRCARLRDFANGGQVLVSGITLGLAADVMPDGTSCRTLGTHELRGMSRAEEVHQLCHPELPDEFPPLASVGANDLPFPVSSFVGRAEELVEVCDLVAEARVVTITGAGGSGKSRLALEVARLQPSARRTWLVELAPIQDAAIVARTVADAIGVVPAGGMAPVDAIAREIGQQPVVLIVDNCEHLLDTCADLTATLTMACPELVVLATSREPLGVAGEITWRIPSLSMPDAVALFTDRARRVATGFEVTDANVAAVEEVCRGVDQLPLAIELAAARCRTLTVDQIDDGLRQRFRLLTGGARDALPRQRSLEASVSWSYELLSGAHRLALARLSVFAGSFDLGGATAVVPDDTLDCIEALVDRSLLQVEPRSGGARYRMLETIRVYARERLTELDDPDEVRNRQLEFARQLAREAGAGVAVDADRWDPILRVEVDNLRAAAEWALASGQFTQLLDMVESLSAFWLARSMQGEIGRLLRDAIASLSIDPAERARAMAVAVPIVLFGGDFAGSFDFACDACDLVLHVDDPALEVTARAMRFCAGVLSGRGDNNQIAADLRATQHEIDRLEDTAAVSILLLVAAAETWWSGFEAGRATLESVLRVAPEDGYESRLSANIWMLNLSADCRVEEFRDNAARAIEAARTLGADTFLTMSLQHAGYSEALYGDEQRARAHVAEAIKVATRSGPLLEYFARRADAWVEIRFGPPAEALAKMLASLDLSHAMRLGVNARIDEWLAGTAGRRAGQPETARRHLLTAIERSTDPAMPFAAGRAKLDLALLDLADDDVDSAWSHAHDALELLLSIGDRAGVLDALDVIAAVAAHSDTAETAARLLGATDAARTELGVAAFTMTSTDRAAVDELLARDCGDPDQHRTEGAQLSLDDAVAFARRGRGDRNRPTSGWQSLTPTELQVVQLVADGLKNAEIAGQLLISTNTVKAHLSHVYRKLDISSRTQLAGEATTRLNNR